jgi:hypothetical protein
MVSGDPLVDGVDTGGRFRCGGFGQSIAAAIFNGIRVIRLRVSPHPSEGGFVLLYECVQFKPKVQVLYAFPFLFLPREAPGVGSFDDVLGVADDLNLARILNVLSPTMALISSIRLFEL